MTTTAPEAWGRHLETRELATQTHKSVRPVRSTAKPRDEDACELPLRLQETPKKWWA